MHVTTLLASAQEVEAELPGLPVTWSGPLSWGAPEAGPGQEIVNAATVMTLEPNLRQPPEWAIWAPDDGAVEPVLAGCRLDRFQAGLSGGSTSSLTPSHARTRLDGFASQGQIDGGSSGG